MPDMLDDCVLGYRCVIINNISVIPWRSISLVKETGIYRENQWVSEWVVWCQFSNFSAISWREQVNFQWDNNVACLVLDQNSQLDFYSASSLKQQSADRHVTPLGVLSLIHKTIHVFILLWKHKRQIKRQKEATVPPLNNTTTMVFYLSLQNSSKKVLLSKIPPTQPKKLHPCWNRFEVNYILLTGHYFYS